MIECDFQAPHNHILVISALVVFGYVKIEGPAKLVVSFWYPF